MVYLFNSIKIKQKNVSFAYFIKVLKFWVKFQSSNKTNKYVGNIMGLILQK